MQTRSSKSPTSSITGESPPATPAAGATSAAVPTSSLPTSERAHWDPFEEDMLVDFLSKEAQLGNMSSNNMFKDPVFAQAVIAIRPFYKKGPSKDVKSCRTKWRAVRISFTCVLPVS
jgi:hypothetical protein